MMVVSQLLKYIPVGATVLLVGAWLFSCIGAVQFDFSWNTQCLGLSNGFGNYTLGTYLGPMSTPRLYAGLYDGCYWQSLTGRFYVDTSPGNLHVQLPQLFLISAFIPLAVGPFIAFRFRLWHYLAFTTLIAVELAYYLRWQS